jgi:hypothetical protein
MTLSWLFHRSNSTLPCILLVNLPFIWKQHILWNHCLKTWNRCLISSYLQLTNQLVDEELEIFVCMKKYTNHSTYFCLYSLKIRFHTLFFFFSFSKPKNLYFTPIVWCLYIRSLYYQKVRQMNFENAVLKNSN